MMKRIVSPALFALALAMPGLAAGETVRREPAGPDERGAATAASKPVTVDRICTLIANEAKLNSIPEDYFARLIWKESRFDHQAISPAGAEGIAQFMPATAKLMDLSDPFDIDQAIPASARHLADLKKNLGNFGLAAAAYNAGEGRVRKLLDKRKGTTFDGIAIYLPAETQMYVPKIEAVIERREGVKLSSLKLPTQPKP